MNNLKNDHPVELLLLAVLAVLWAVVTAARLILVPLLALTLVLLTPRRQAPAPAAPEPAAVAPEPPAPAAVAAPVEVPMLASLADLAAATLQPLTMVELRRQARAAGLPRSLSRNARKTDLVMALAGLEVALI